MRGEIITYDKSMDSGLISGDDSRRYRFRLAELTESFTPQAGQRVDFIISGDEARSIMLTPAYSSDVLHSVEPDLGLWGYFKRAMTKRYFEGNGRARRKEFWGFTLFATLFSILSIIPTIALIIIDETTGADLAIPGVLSMLIPTIWALAYIIPYIALYSRRLHDVGMSGWLYLAAFVPFGGLFLLVVAFLPSQPHINAYGPPPVRPNHL